MGSEVVTAVIVQKADFKSNPSNLSPSTSRPIQQTIFPSSFSFHPIQQLLQLRTNKGASNKELSKPIEQIGSLKFAGAGVAGLDSVIEQIEITTNGVGDKPDYDGPVELFQKSGTFVPLQQFILRTNLTSNTSRPIEQKDEISDTVAITQFDFIEVIVPVCGSIKNPVNTNILWRVRNSGFPFNLNTLIFTVNGVQVQDRPSFSAVLLPNGLEINYDPPVDFEYESEVQIVFEIQDTANTPNTFNSYCAWQTVPDTIAPVFSNIIPACASIEVSPTVAIEFDVTDIGAGVDPTSIQISVEGLTVCSGISIEEITTASGTSYHVIYEHPDTPFNFESEVTLALQASDLSTLRNTTLFLCSFTIRPSTPPEFINLDPAPCESPVDTETGVSFEVYGVEQGVDISTLEVIVDKETRRVYVAPRLRRTE